MHESNNADPNRHQHNRYIFIINTVERRQKQTSAVIPNKLNSIPVAADVKSISATFSGNANAIVPLLIISAKAASEACSTAGFFSSGQKCLNDAFPLSVDIDDSLINIRMSKALIKNNTATSINTYATFARAAIAPPTAGPTIAAVPIQAPVRAITLPLDFCFISPM